MLVAITVEFYILKQFPRYIVLIVILAPTVSSSGPYE